ncbi:peptidase [Alkalihalophilus marmarensis]|uniref:Acetylornithine deacetylase n=1 Tax=Alkalihalophilus marmarensis DSM 21297 TaxID=1188261 RepID=U6SSU2_9BACI|nr:peptidase [Alkalihalophilus marmarensis]ERN53721.1 acetylornithine deacetylase [Alkalihalophilus marmarensis DSM 21297]
MKSSVNKAQVIKQSIDSKKNEIIHLLRVFVQAESTQGNERGAQSLVIETLQQMGLEVDVWEPDAKEITSHRYFASSRTEFRGSPNVVGVLKGTGGGRSIILNGHIDVVPAGDVTQWRDHPYSGVVKDGKMYGRGVTDMKGGNVALLLAIQAIQEANIALKGDVIFQSVIEEESGGTGTLAALLRGYKADAAIIPEPTNMKFFPKQQGSMWFKLHVKGLSAHGGTRYEGVSAIEKSMTVINHIKELEKIRNDSITDPLYQTIPIPIPINIGKIHGGDWPSSVPDLVTVEGRFGVSPEETIEEAKEEMKQWIRRLAEKDPWFEEFPVTLEWFGARWLPGSLDPNHSFMQLLGDKYKEVIGAPPVIEASPWGTDGGLLTEIGSIPTVVFGPGVTEKAHFPNEYIELEKVFSCAEVIAHTIIDWCGDEKG